MQGKSSGHGNHVRIILRDELIYKHPINGEWEQLFLGKVQQWRENSRQDIAGGWKDTQMMKVLSSQ